MKLKVNVIIQGLGSALVLAQIASGFLPPAQAKWGAVAVSVIQGMAAVLSHFSNTDGTPQTVAYVPEPPKR